MPAPRLRSRTYRRVQKKLPSGVVKTHYIKRAKGLAKCAVCKTEIKGVPHNSSKLGVSKKRPQRAYGGYLCANCARAEIKKEARV